MEKAKFLLFYMAGRFYLCREQLIDRIISLSKNDLYIAPIQSSWIRYLILYDGMIVPVVKEHGEILCEKMYNVVILKKVFNFVGFFVDFIERFVEIEKEVIEKAIYAPVFMAKKVIMYDDKECYLLDIEALVEGRE